MGWSPLVFWVEKNALSKVQGLACIRISGAIRLCHIKMEVQTFSKVEHLGIRTGEEERGTLSGTRDPIAKRYNFARDFPSEGDMI